MPAPVHAAVDLTSLSLEQLLDLSIVGASKYEQKQGEVAAAVSIITRQEIKAFGWRTLVEALGSLPGVYTTYDRQYSYLGVRGFGLPGDYNTRVLVMIDGNRVNDPTFDTGPTGRNFPLDMDLVERIEFIPGPGGAVYGQNAMLGVVNVITRSGADVGGELAVRYQSPQAQREGRASFGRRFENGVDVLVSVSGMHARGEDRFFDYGASGRSGVATGLDGERDKEFFARISGGAWNFEYVDGERRKDDPTGALLSDPLVAGSFQSDRYRLAQLRYEDSLAEDLQLSARVFIGSQYYRSLLTYGTPIALPADSEWHGAELRLVSTALSGHKLMLGVEAQDNTRQDQAVLDLSDPANDIHIERTGYRIGIYGQDEWRISGSLVATAGLRVDRNNVTGLQTSPRAALIWRASTDSTLKALYGRAYRAPNSFERDYGDGLSQVANPALGGETIDTIEVVADHRLTHDATLRGSVYEWNMRDLVTLGSDPLSGLAQYQSGESVKARGIELSADKTWASGARLRASVSMQRASYASDGSLPNSAHVLGKLNMTQPLPVAGLLAGYELRYDGRRLSRDGSELGSYALSNLTLSTDLPRLGVEASLGVFNLFDKRYAQPGADINWQNSLEQDGRSIRLRLAYRF